MKRITVTLQEIWNATRSNVTKNKKKYSRKTKHKKNSDNE